MSEIYKKGRKEKQRIKPQCLSDLVFAHNKSPINIIQLFTGEEEVQREVLYNHAVLIVAENVCPLISECEIVFITMIVMLLLLHIKQNLESKEVLNKIKWTNKHLGQSPVKRL